MFIRNVVLLAFLLAGASAHSDPPFATYTAEITELNGSGVTATAVVFAGINGNIGYGGFAEGLQSDLEAATVSQIHRTGVAFVKLIDSIDVYLTDLVCVVLFFSSPSCFKSALKPMGVASTFTPGLVVKIPRHKVAITLLIPSRKIHGWRHATRVAPTARRRFQGSWI